MAIAANLATMANGLPYTLAAQVAHPQRQCVAFVGTAAFPFAMLTAEFVMALKYQLPVKRLRQNSFGRSGLMPKAAY